MLEQSLIEALTQPVVFFTPEGAIVRANPAFREMIHTEEESIDDIQLLTSTISLLDQTSWSEAITAITSTSTPQSIQIDYHQRRYEVSIYSLAAPSTTDLVLSAIFSDCTQATNRIDSLTRTNQELQEFASIASHDLQEPARTMASFASLLQTRYESVLDEKGHRFLHHIVSGASRMQGLIQRLLSYSRLDSRAGPLVPFDGEEMLGSVLRQLRPTLRERQAEISHQPLPALYGDRNQIAQVFQELIANAILYNQSTPPRVDITVDAPDNPHSIHIRVTDNGIGIAQEHREQIFKIFHRLHTRDEFAGYGVGLAICRKVLFRHEGTICIEHSSNEGSTFLLTLPRISP